jgi:hypothetical protein
MQSKFVSVIDKCNKSEEVRGVAVEKECDNNDVAVVMGMWFYG